jgi:very-short-patch-repair endonuclease
MGNGRGPNEALTRRGALAAGFTDGQLRGPTFHRAFHGAYVPVAVADDLLIRCWAAALVLSDHAAFSYETAAALYFGGGPRVDHQRIHVSVPSGEVVPRHRRMVGHERQFEPNDVRQLFGFRVLSPACTFLDLAAMRDDAHLMAFGDAVLRHHLAERDQLQAQIDLAVRRRGVTRARWVLANLDPRAESPMESVLRSILLRGRLPRPEVNVDVLDAAGRFVARADLLYRREKVIVEYGGDQHRTDRQQFSHDLRRLARLQQLGYIVLRFTAVHVYRERAWVVATVEAALRARAA